MKKLLMVVITLITSISAFSQVDVSTLNPTEKKIFQVFKESYVDKTFKDPYSFKLLKLVTTPITFGQWNSDDINFLKNQIAQKDFRVFSKHQIEDKIVEKQKNLDSMSDEIKNTVKCYQVSIDCYGNNSYGGQVLNKYSFNYVLYGNDLSVVVDYTKDDKLWVSKTN